VAKSSTPNLGAIRSKDPLLGDALQYLEDRLTLLEKQTTASTGSSSPPSKIASLNVISANGVFDVSITDSSPVLRGINYFVEYSTNPQFTKPIVVDLGASRNHRMFLDSGTYYFRAYSQYPTSERSVPVYFGSHVSPTGVAGGGAIAGPTPLGSQGSGTTVGPSGSDGGFGNQIQRGNVA